MPARELATVRIIEWVSSRLNIAGAGDNIATGLQGIGRIHVMSGGVLWHPDYTVFTSFSLELKILVVDITAPILPGLQISKQKGKMHSISSFSTYLEKLWERLAGFV
jgi:elongation factor 1 alpha-like protein